MGFAQAPRPFWAAPRGLNTQSRAGERPMWVLDAFGLWIKNGLRESWIWITGLNYQEWFLLLGITAAAGLLCMRGFGSRANY
jgi:hypothetical protein